MSIIKTIAAGLDHSTGYSGAAVGVVAEGPAVKQVSLDVPVASPLLSASTVVKLGATPLGPLTYEASITSSVDHLRVGIAKYLGHGA